MKTALRALALLQLFAAAASAESLYFNSKLDLPAHTLSPRPQHPTRFGKSYIGSPRSYAAEPKEIEIAGKTLTTGLAATGALKASDPLSTAGFLLIGLLGVRDISRAIKQPRQRSSWSFIWSRSKP
jgi:hypothetical protein